ncbi:MAG: hypothetical protein WBM86_25945, partial [Waterburya sp.]
FGVKVLSSKLNPTQIEDLSYLKEDLRLGEGITGNFISTKPQQLKDIQTQEVAVASESITNNATQDSQNQDFSSVFSEYLQQRDGNTLTEGHINNTESLDLDYER